MQALILRVLVVDDSEIVRRGICQILETQVDIEVIREAFEAARRIKHELPSTLILMVSQFDSAPFQREAITAGASGYVVKTNAVSELIPALRKLHSQHAANLRGSSNG